MIEAVCLFAAYVTAEPAFNKTNVIRHQSDPPCVVDARVTSGQLVLTREVERVSVPFPGPTGWYALEFLWGNQFARFAEKDGPKVLYVPVKRE